MVELKLTKTGLRDVQMHLAQLLRYLPTLQLKKALLQVQVNEVRQEIHAFNLALEKKKSEVVRESALLQMPSPIDLEEMAKVTQVRKRMENVAGVDVPIFEGIEFEEVIYSLFDTPLWMDQMITLMRSLQKARAKVAVAILKKQALEKELREVSIRVNLFEKILIPRAKKNMRKIAVFLGDLQLSSVSQAKVAKAKIEMRKNA